MAAAGLPPLPPLRPAATAPPRPRIMAMIDAACACASCWRKRDRCPPAMWPVSCASTPMTSFGTLASISAPALMKMRLAIHHEGVERAVVDDGDLDVLLREAGGAQDGLRVVAQQLLDLGVADDRKSGRQALRARRRRRDGDRRRNRDRERRQQRKRARGWRPPPHPDSASGVQSCPFGTASPMFSQPSGAPRAGSTRAEITCRCTSRCPERVL